MPPEASRLPVPFIRWADVVRVPLGGFGALERRLYDHEFVYVLEGSGHIVLDGVSHEAIPDCLFLVQPNVQHTFSSSQSGQRLLGVHFDWHPRDDIAGFQSFLAATKHRDSALMRPCESVPGWNLNERPYLNLEGRPRVRKMLEEVVAEYNRADAEARFMAGALLAATIGQMEREARLLGELSRHQKVGADAVRRVQKARELLESHPESPLSIEDIAGRVGWSSDHLRRMFRAVLDASPLEIQTAARIRRAQELLRYGELSTAEIGRRCGFLDASQFTRAFRAQTGLTPREWLGLARGI